MHWTGLSGIPRRIPDYPDAWLECGVISSLGSIISVMASLWFLSFLFYDLRDLASNGADIDSSGTLFMPNTTWLQCMFAATPNLIPTALALVPLTDLTSSAVSHSTLETLLLSPMPFHSACESPSAYSGNAFISFCWIIPLTIAR